MEMAGTNPWLPPVTGQLGDGAERARIPVRPAPLRRPPRAPGPRPCRPLGRRPAAPSAGSRRVATRPPGPALGTSSGSRFSSLTRLSLILPVLSIFLSPDP